MSLRFGAACAAMAIASLGAQQTPPAESLEREVRALAGEMVAAFKRDPASTARFYSDDARIMGGGSRYSGRQQVDQYWSGATMFTDWAIEVFEVGGDRNTPWLLGRSTLTGQGGRTMATDFVGLLKRGPDGRLRFYIDMFTAAAAPRSPTAGAAYFSR